MEGILPVVVLCHLLSCWGCNSKALCLTAILALSGLCIILSPPCIMETHFFVCQTVYVHVSQFAITGKILTFCKIKCSPHLEDLHNVWYSHLGLMSNLDVRGLVAVIPNLCNLDCICCSWKCKSNACFYAHEIK